MPANKYALLRYRIIDRCISNEAKPYPTKEELRQACEDALFGSDGENISESTIEKDLWAMRNENDLGYHAPISYSKAHKGYCYTDPEYSISDLSLNDDDLDALNFAADTIMQFRNIPIFSQYENAIEKIVSRLKITPDVNDRSSDRFIQFEEAPEVKGAAHLTLLLECIKERKEIEFDYEKFSDGSNKKHTVHPYLLKEYRNRWYLISWEADRDDYRTYALDRISELKSKKQGFDQNPNFNIDRFFAHSIGITEIDSEPVLITLECSNVRAKYLDSQPIHRSQKINWLEDGKAHVMLKVLITYELIAELLSHANTTKVISPSSLQGRIKHTLEENLRLYS
jgi:predicted DNA-binding transcriptional regulator YafY